MPPTRREQLELDELLSDIYRGIETLPDVSSAPPTNSNHHYNHNQYSSPAATAARNSYARSYVKEYELPASSPLVKQHKQELAALRSGGNINATGNATSNALSGKQPQRSTLKRHTPESGSRPQAQPLTSFVTSTTPDNKRRVRIVDHPDKLAKDYGNNNVPQDSSNTQDYYYDDYPAIAEDNNAVKGGGKVKHVNTNKLIYHQERNPDDEQASDSDNNNSGGGGADDDDDIDGVSRVEYYHTTWLDRQLGRASKRRSSKELNERQVKEKAMIEELKRSLKNGAITLRQSFKGKKNQHKNKPSETYDDQMLDSNRHAQSRESTSVIRSGLATIPRNYHNNNRKQQQQQLEQRQNSYYTNSATLGREQATPKQTIAGAPTCDYTTTHSQFDSAYQLVQSSPATTTTATTTTRYQEPRQQQQQQQPLATESYSSRTLPHNYQSKAKGDHQLLQSHYRGGNKNFNTINNSVQKTTITNTSSLPKQQQQAQQQQGDTMRNYGNSPNCGRNTYNGAKSPTSQRPHDQHQHPHPDQQQQPPLLGNTISSIPSATEVVRSALSRSSSQVSLNQLNKTINLLPTSPPPYGSSPATPTQQLRAASPSLSPSPTPRSPAQQLRAAEQTSYAQHQARQYSSKTMEPSDRQQQQQLGSATGQPALHGTRTVGRPPQPVVDRYQQQQQHQQKQQQQQPIYANPHASLMQHRAEQQMRTPQGRNTASIREFNELDSLLRSLSPGSTTVSTHITPGYSSKPAQPTFGGYGYTAQPPVTQHHHQPVYQPAHYQQQQPPRQVYRTGSDIYAKVRKPHQPQIGADQTKASYLQQHYMPAGGAHMTTTHDPYTLDVSEKRDEDCLDRQNLSEFEPPIELVPSMEDYQNISLLNPVKNHYWYKPNMSRERAISLLKDKPQGTFIVRDSTSFKGAYGLAVKVSRLPKNVMRNPNGDPSAELIRHFLIEPTSNGVRLKGYENEPVFDNLPNLIYQHSLTELALPCKLVIPRADIEDPKFIHKQKQFFDEFLASKEQAKHQPYERTSPDGGYRKYPGQPPVYVHNEHRIIFE